METEGPARRDEVEGWRAEVGVLHARSAGRFRRGEVRERVHRYLAGLLGRVERKNGWQLAEHLGEAGPQGVQRLLNAARWDADGVRDDLRCYVVDHLGDPNGVLIVDETGFLKKGTKSVGVQRQYSGTAGRIEDCQVGVFLAYAGAAGRACLDRELYLPQEWAADDARRREAGVPAEVAFATKPRLARRVLGRAFAAGVPAAWVAGDAVYGDASDPRRWLGARNAAYVLAVSCGHLIRQAGQQQRAAGLIATVPAAAWVPLSAGAGSQGARLYDWTWIRLPYESPAQRAQWLLARRRLSDPTDVAYYRAFGPAHSTLAVLVRVAGARWASEEHFEDAKGMAGLDQDEVRQWDAWYRHVTLALLAHAYLAVTRHRARGADPEQGAVRAS